MKHPIIVVPIDFTEISENAIPFAVHIAKAIQAGIVLLHVQPSNSVQSIPDDLVVDPFNSGVGFVETKGGYFLKEFQQELEEDYPEVKFRSVIRMGNVHSELVKISNMADLVVIGTKGRNGFLRGAVGSRSAKLIGLLNVPVMVVPEGAKSTNVSSYFDHVAFASGFDKEQLLKRELHDVVSFCEIFNSFITFLHVEQEFLNIPIKELHSTGSYLLEPKVDLDDIKTLAKEKGRRLKAEVKKIADYPKDKRKFVILSIEKSDDVKSAMLDYITNHKVGIISMVKRNRGVLGSFFHKSLTKQLAESKIQIPLLIYSE